VRIVKISNRTVAALKQLRILLAELKPMLREIVRNSVANEPDMQIVGDTDNRERVFESISDVDVVILGAPEPSDSVLAQDVLRASSSTRVLAIAANGRSASMWLLQPYPVPLGEVSPTSLVGAIRASGRRVTTADREANQVITP
jgi:DNA-binding NarL/FixJ family response regulator